ncbi:phosphate acyltransferase PlsX, partial [Burkholderia cenocepacia]
NILLKSSEGLAGMLVAKVEALFRRSIAARIVGAVALPLLRRLRAELNPAQYNGASFLGLQGIVVKSHGSAGADGFKAAIRRAAQDVEHDLPAQLRDRLGQFFRVDGSSGGTDDVTARDGWPSN